MNLPADAAADPCIDSSSAVNPVNELVEQFLERQRRGERPSIDEYVLKHPELADQLQAVLPGLALVEDLKPRSVDATGSFREPVLLAGGNRLERIGDFRLLREVGRGGMGVVYEAEQESLGRRVAVKVLAGPHLLEPMLVRRFQREARSAANLHHTNIVPVFGVGEHEGLYYYVMQFIQGLALNQVLVELRRLRDTQGTDRGRGLEPLSHAPAAAGGGLTASQVARSLASGIHTVLPGPSSPGAQNHPGSSAPAAHVADISSAAQVGTSTDLSSLTQTDRHYYQSVARIGVQVASALEYANSKGTLHRDIKPSNLLLDAQGNAWVADFGLAKAVDQENLTQSGDIVGTLRYMAPERFKGQCDARSDVYALGLTLYEMLTLKPAFAEADKAKLIQQVMHETPVPPRKRDARIPADLETIVLKAIERDAAHRYTDAASMQRDLERFLEDRPILARRVSSRERVWRWCRRNPALASVSAALILVLLSAVAVLSISNHQIRRETIAKEVALLDKEEALRTAQAQEQLANDNAKKFDDQRRIAVEREQRAQEQELLARRRHYAAQINLANLAWQNQELPRLYQIVEDLRPRPIEPDLRSFEWYYLWQRANAHLEREIEGASPSLNDVAFSTDGKMLALASVKVVQLLDSATMKEIGRLDLPRKERVWGTAFSPNGKTLAIAHDAGVRLWDVPSRTLSRTLLDNAVVRAMVFTPDGRRLVTGSSCSVRGKHVGSGIIRIWNLDTGMEEAVLKAHDAAPMAMALSPDGRWLVTGSGWGDDTDGGSFIIWDLPARRMRLHRVQLPTWKACFSPDGKLLARGHDGGVEVLEVPSFRQVRQLAVHAPRVSHLWFTPDSRRLIWTCEDEAVRAWDMQAAKSQVLGILDGHAIAAVLAPDGSRLVATGQFGAAKVFLLNSSAPVEKLALPEPPQRLQLLPGGKQMLVASSSHLHSVNIATGLVESTTDLASVCAVSQDGARLATTTNGKSPITIWNRADKKPVQTLRVGDFTRAQFSPDGQWLATWPAFGGSWARLWEIQSGQLAKTVNSGDYGGVMTAAFSPDGHKLALGFQLNRLAIYNRGTDKLISRGHPFNHLWEVSFSPDGRMVAAGTEDGTVAVFDSLSLRPVSRMVGHTDLIRQLCFTTDGKTLASCSRDGSVKFWDVPTGQERLSMRQDIDQMAFTPDGMTLVAAHSGRGELQFWRGSNLSPARARRKGFSILDPANPMETWDEGNVQWWTGNLERAEKLYEEALGPYRELNVPPTPQFEVTLIGTLCRLAGLHQVLGQEARSRTRMDEATNRFEKLGSDERDLVISDVLNQARNLAFNKRGEDASILFDLAARLAPKDPSVWIRRGRARGKDEKDQAVADLTRAIELAPGDWTAWSWRGYYQAARGRFEDAIHDTDASLSEFDNQELLVSEEDRLSGLLNLLLYQLGTKDLAGYRKTFARCLARFVHSVDVNTQVNLTLYAILAPDAVADYTPILDLARRIVQQSPPDSDFFNRLGAVLFRAGYAAEAAEFLQQADQVFDKLANPQAVRPYLRLFQAMTHHRLGRREEAQQSLRSAKEEIEREKYLDEAKATWQRRVLLGGLLEEAENMLKVPLARPVAAPRPLDRQVQRLMEARKLGLDSLFRELKRTPSETSPLCARNAFSVRVVQNDRLYQLMCEDRPDDMQIRLARARFLAWQSRWQDAASVYAEAHEISPIWDEAVEPAAIALLRGDHDAYCRHFTQLRAEVDANPRGRGQSLLARVGILASAAPADAESLIRWALPGVEEAPSDASLRHTLASAHLRAKQSEAAIAEYQRSIEVAPKWPAQPLNWVGLALANLQLGRRPEADRWFAKASVWLDSVRKDAASQAVRFPPTLHIGDWLEGLLLEQQFREMAAAPARDRE